MTLIIWNLESATYHRVSYTHLNFDENGQYNFGGIMIFNTGCENEAKDFGFSENDKACYDIPIMTLSTHS